MNRRDFLAEMLGLTAMTTNYHTPIISGAAATAAVINDPLSELDSKVTNVNSEIYVARNGQPNLHAEIDRVDDRISSIIADSGTSSTEVVDARTAIPHSTAPTVLANTLALLAASARNVKAYGATGDGTTNDTTAVQAALTAGGVVLFPPGTYLVTGLTSGASTTHIFGLGNATIKSATDAAILTVSADNLRIDNMRFLGDGKGATADAGKTGQHGIVLNEKYQARITSCHFKDLGGGGVYVTATIGTNHPGNLISGCVFDACNRGVYSGARGEYLLVTNCSITGGNYGIHIGGGNCNFSNCNINNNITGVHIAAGDNAAHGTIADCNINHNTTYSVVTEDISLGEMFVGCNLVGGYMFLKGELITFIRCNINQDAYYFDGCTAVIENCYLPDTLDNTINNNYNAHDSMVMWRNNVLPTGQMPQAWVENIPGGVVRTTQTVDLTISNSATDYVLKMDTVVTSSISNQATGFTRYSFYATGTGIYASRGLNGGNANIRLQLFFTKPANWDALTVSVKVNTSVVVRVPIVSYSATQLLAVYGGPLWVDADAEITVVVNNQTGGNITFQKTNSTIQIAGL